MSIVYDGFGNILNHKAQTITCPVNVVGAMGKGLAMAMRTRFHGLFDYYKTACQTGEITIGTCNVFNIQGQDRKILLFPSKDHWKDPSKLEFIETALKHLVKQYENFGIEELAIPPVGCGLGGLDFTTQVKPMIYDYLDPIPLEVYLLHRDPLV